MQDIEEVVNMAVTEAIQQKLHKCVEDRLNANFFIARAEQNAIVKEILDYSEYTICQYLSYSQQLLLVLVVNQYLAVKDALKLGHPVIQVVQNVE